MDRGRIEQLDAPSKIHGFPKNPNRDALRAIRSEISHNPAVFPDAAAMKRLHMMRELDWRNRRVLNCIWTEIRLR